MKIIAEPFFVCQANFALVIFPHSITMVLLCARSAYFVRDYDVVPKFSPYWNFFFTSHCFGWMRRHRGIACDDIPCDANSLGHAYDDRHRYCAGDRPARPKFAAAL